MGSSRIENTKKNIIWSYVDFGISLVFQFISRTVIIYVLGAQYLGLSSLFTSILQVLNMAELGFSSAVIYNLYKPIAENDINTVCALLAFYRRVYRIVGCIIILVGLSLVPFLSGIIKGGYPSDINLYALYLLYLSNTGISYFLFAYKASLLNALQRMDLTKIAYSIVHVLQCIAQIIVLMVFRNYYLFVFIIILGSAAKNILAAYFAKKHFPQYICRGRISSATRNDIWKRVKGLLICKISGVTYTTFDSIILSSMIGLVSVAVYNNYLTIYNAIANIIIILRHAMQASVGNSVASESVEKNYHDILKWQYMFSMIALWCGICLMCLYQPFMELWMGKDLMLSLTDVFLLSILLVVSTVQHAFYLYLSGNGLWWELRWPYILSTVSNLLMNIVFCRWWGVTGIILATVIAQTVFGLICHCTIVFKVYFRCSAKHYFARQLVYFVNGFTCGIITYMICSMVSSIGISAFLVKTAICAILPPIYIYIIFHKTDYFQQSKEIVLRLIGR